MQAGVGAGQWGGTHHAYPPTPALGGPALCIRLRNPMILPGGGGGRGCLPLCPPQAAGETASTPTIRSQPKFGESVTHVLFSQTQIYR